MNSRPLVTILGLLTAGAILIPSGSRAQRAPPVVGRSKDLLVRISITRPALEPDGDKSVGAGIIVGYRDDTLFIATARHLLCPNREAPCKTKDVGVQVAFRADPGRSVPAKIWSIDPALDLAFLHVSGLRQLSIDPAHLPYGRLSSRQRHARNTELIPVGCRTIVDCWTEPLERGRYDGSIGPHLLFRLSGIEPGYSGGAVFLRHEELVGMTLVGRDAVSNVQAIAIDSIASHARAAGVPFMLRPPRLPPGGYKFVGTAGLIVGWTALPRHLGYSGYAPVSGFQLGVSSKLAGRAYSSAVVRVTYTDAARAAAVSVGPELRVPFTSDPDHLPAFSYSIAIRGTVARVFSQRLTGGYYDKEDHYFILEPIDRTALAPSLSIQPEMILRPHLTIGTGFTYEPYIGIGKDYPGYLALFVFRIGVAL